jgi:hypothetical protein
MASGTGMSNVHAPAPAESGSSLLHQAHPIALPNSLGGNTANYESKGGYVPKIKKTVKIRGGKSRRRSLKKKASSRRSRKARR